MRIVLSYLFSFIQEHKKPAFWITFFLFNAFCIFINYTWRFESNFINSPNTAQEWQFLYYFLFYAAAWLSTFVIYHWYFPEQALLQKYHFWTISLLILALLSIYVNFDYFYREWVYRYFHSDIQYFVMKCLNNTVKPILMLPLLVFYWFQKDKQALGHFYGLFPIKKHNLKIYGLMFLAMIPLVYVASFSEDFLAQYPRYKPEYSQAEEYLGWKNWQTVVLFEFCYGIDFVFIELFFRGFMIFALLRHLGSSVVFGMASVYVFIHFEKPLGETIGSLFGGLVLGVLAYRSQSIWGGIVIHLGIAWLMELLAWLQRII